MDKTPVGLQAKEPAVSDAVITTLPAPAADAAEIKGPLGSDTTDGAVDDVASTPQETRDLVVRSTGKGYTSVRSIFVQRFGGDERSSTLARLCRERKHRALILYLLLLTIWGPQRGPLRSEFWLRALDVKGSHLTWSRSSVSQTFTALVDLDLADRSRVKRLSHLVATREDGSGDPYEPPVGKKKSDWYFSLPGAFWTDGWFGTLSLPGLCMLLLLLKETNDLGHEEFHITYPQVEEWYGISASSAQKGLCELRECGLVSLRKETVKAGWEADGTTIHFYYTLNGEFSTGSRVLARETAQKAARRRSGSASGVTGKAASATTAAKTSKPVKAKKKKPIKSKKAKSRD